MQEIEKPADKKGNVKMESGILEELIEIMKDIVIEVKDTEQAIASELNA